MKRNSEYFKKKLQDELTLLQTELESVGIKNPSNPLDWEATVKDTDLDTADEMELADTIESYEDNTAILKQLEIQYNKVKEALVRIDVGTYGICNICGEEIEEDRLEANPSADTCIAHRDED